MRREREVFTESQGKMRLAAIEEEKRLEEETRERARKNRNFTQIYPQGLKVINDLAEEKQTAAIKLYTFLIKEMAWDVGAIVASQSFLAEKLELSVATIKRACISLEAKHALLRISLGKGTVQAYCLNPHHVWKSWDTKKDYAAFKAKTLAHRKDNPDIERTLKIMLKTWEEKGTLIGEEQDETEEYSLDLPLQSSNTQEDSLQEQAKAHQERKKKQYLNDRKAQLLVELAELNGEI